MKKLLLGAVALAAFASTAHAEKVVLQLKWVTQAQFAGYYVAQEKGGMTVATQTPVTLGDTVDNSYSVTAGLKTGDKVIVSSTQFLVNGMPVILLPH